MKIKEIKSQHRRDFRAIYECEHCGNTTEEYGYGDTNFHNNVIPTMICSKCGETAPDNYRPLAPKYSKGEIYRIIDVCKEELKRR